MKRPAFTLLEVLVAATVLAVALTTTAAFLRALLRTETARANETIVGAEQAQAFLRSDASADWRRSLLASGTGQLFYREGVLLTNPTPQALRLDITLVEAGTEGSSRCEVAARPEGAPFLWSTFLADPDA